MNMIMVVIVIVRMRVRGPIMSVFMAVRCASGDRRLMGMVVVPVAVSMLVRVFNRIVCVRVGMVGHVCLLVGSALIVATRGA